ncbi:alpha/beta hydrolase family protein [Psychrobacter sp. 1044]|uniref:alpha/beta hydrolase family protein n=1 Tax=Psychrobacter sp. 1044 TaxID=2772562 RepID=UPI00191B0B46|nr:hypothetical protein [Psychrobacter sp. 1044]
MEINKKVAKLIRRVAISEGKIILETDELPDTEYAFYLYHKNGTDKLFYSPESRVNFQIPIETGEYSARFFYRTNDVVEVFTLFFVVDKDEKIYSAEKELVIDEDGFGFDYYNNNSLITFVVFNGDGTKISTLPFGLGFLIKLGFNVIGVRQDNNCYQLLSYEKFREIVQPIVRGKKTFLYGSSLGGYCALYYAGAINGVVIAAAPRNPIHSSIENMTTAVGKHDYLHEDMKSNPITSKFALVVFDPENNVDKVFFDQVVAPSYPNLKLLEAPNAGHEVLLHLNHTRQLKNIIINIVEGFYGNVRLDNSLKSPYTDKNLAFKHFKSGNYRETIYYASSALKESSKVKLDKELVSIINHSLSKI